MNELMNWNQFKLKVALKISIADLFVLWMHLEKASQKIFEFNLVKQLICNCQILKH